MVNTVNNKNVNDARPKAVVNAALGQIKSIYLMVLSEIQGGHSTQKLMEDMLPLSNLKGGKFTWFVAMFKLGKAKIETVPGKDYILLPLWNGDDEKNVTEEPGKEGGDSSKDSEINDQEKADNMDVKIAFLYGKIEEEVYVCQPPGFEDLDFPDRVYKVEKALYGLHQAPRAWYETLSTYLLDNGFQRGKIDKTLFIKRDKGLQEKQKIDGIFISQDKYVTEILKKFGFTNVKKARTPMETQKLLLKDEDGEEVDVYLYRSMIGSLMYLTSSRPDIMYLKGQPKLGLWYPKDSPFDLVAYTDSDYVGASLDRKSITRDMLIRMELSYAGDSNVNVLMALTYCCWEKLMLLGINLLLLGKVNAARHNLQLLVNATTKVKTVNGEVQLQDLVNGKKIIVTKAFVRRDLQLNDEEGMDCLPNATIFEERTRMGYEKLSQKLTFYKAFFSPQWKFLIHTIMQCLSAKTTAWNEFSSTMASAIISLATNQKFNFSKFIFESMVKNLDNAGKFLMYPRFVQVFLD
ncbi:putative ribonuclease H-like domain-containing protein, partial [Tanacetum coccineum]